MMDRPFRLQRGATMVEVLVALIVSVFGLLGLIGLQMRAYSAETESYQRTQAAILLADMVNRIEANRANAASYVAADIGVDEPEDCAAAAPGAALDLCEWGNLLRGAAESDGETLVGAMLAARGCITNPQPDLYVVAVAWHGTVPTGAPATSCGQGQYSSEALRRAVTAVVRIADLGA